MDRQAALLDDLGIAIQLGGRAAKLADSEVPATCDQYFSRLRAKTAIGLDEPNSTDCQGSDPDAWKFVRITPSELWYFDTRYFGEERAAVPAEIWRHDE